MSEPPPETSKRAAAAAFWAQYDIPIEYDTAIKVRRSGLLRGSSGTGHAADTVIHVHVKEPFTDGRLSRDADSYLCEKGSNVFQNAREERHIEDDEQYRPAITCNTCLARMARWKSDPEEPAADHPNDE